MPTEREDVVLLGRTIGTAHGYDRDEDFLTFYDFEPIATILQLQKGDLSANLEAGVFEYYNDDGVVTKTIDMFDVLSQVTRDGPTV